MEEGDDTEEFEEAAVAGEGLEEVDAAEGVEESAGVTEMLGDDEEALAGFE